MSENEIVKHGEEFFEEKAREILTHLKSAERYGEKYFPRPFFVEFFGSPSAGKTLTITEIDKFLRRQGFRVWKPQEGAEVIRHIERDTPLYNLRTAQYALQILVDQSVGHLYDVIIFDRCLFDACCWMLYWQEKKKLSSVEVDNFIKFFLSRFWVDKIDIAYMMTCEPEKAMERELRIALSRKLGETTNPETITKIIERCRTVYNDFSPDHPQLRHFDTTNMDESEMVRRVAEDILLTLSQKTKKK
jgi:hypothetical protein